MPEEPIRRKYPRTFHVPWSRSVAADDRVQADLSLLRGQEVVVTEKLDGECTSIYSDGRCHARSLDSGPHPSRTSVRALAAAVGPQLPGPQWRLTGENLYAAHSIRYQDLPGHFCVFGLWHGTRCASWDDTAEWAELLDLPTVPVLHRGPLPPAAELDRLWRRQTAGHESEGYVVRPAAAIELADWPRSVLKWVRPRHVTTADHWMSGPVTVNGLAEPSALDAAGPTIVRVPGQSSSAEPRD